MLVIYAVLVSIVLWYLFIVYYHYTRTICYRTISSVCAALFGPHHTPQPTRPPSPAPMLARASSRFDTLLNTEAYFIESKRFSHVENVAVLNTRDFNYNDIFFHHAPEAIVEWAEGVEPKPRLKYVLNHDGTVNAVLY